MSLTLDSRVVAESSIAFTEVQGELTLLDPRSGIYYGLNRVGTVVWRAIPSPVTLRGVVEKVVQQFDVTTERCEKDVLGLAEELLRRNLIRIVG